jgi:hypothetical protein
LIWLDGNKKKKLNVATNVHICVFFCLKKEKKVSYQKFSLSSKKRKQVTTKSLFHLKEKHIKNVFYNLILIISGKKVGGYKLYDIGWLSICIEEMRKIINCV